MALRDWFRRPVAAAAVKGLDPDQLPKQRAQNREAGEAWLAYRMLGEVGAVTNQQARLVGRLDWTVTLPGAPEPLDTANSDALLRAAFGDNLEDLANRAALCLQVPGGYVLARTVANDPNSWRVFSAPLSPKDQKRVETSDVIVSVRVEDPEDASRHDSPVLRSLPTCRELILLRAQSRAQSRSRTAQHGLLLYPAEGVKDQAAFEANLQDVITAPLADERSTASVTPNVVGFPAEYIEKWSKIDLSGDYDEKLDKKDERLVRSLAVQLDAPPEILLGFGDSNHWSTWAIQEDNWLGYVQPIAKPIGMGFAVAIERATGAEGLKIEPDPGPLLIRRPSTADALTAFDAGLVSGDWTREQLGADETDAPTPQEVAARTPAAPQAAPAAMEPQAIAAALRHVFPESKPERPALVAAPKHAPDPRVLSAIDTQAYDATEDLVNDTAERCLERLGAKVRSMSRSIEIPEGKSNVDLAVWFTGAIPNADQAIADTITSALPRLDRLTERAFARTRSAGVDVQRDPDDYGSASSLFASLVAEVVQTRLAVKPTDALAWQAGRRVIALVGGNGDPMTQEAS